MGYLEERAGLEGKCAAVIGGAQGVGAAVTMALARAGVDVALCDLDPDQVAVTCADVEKLGRRATGRVIDAFDPDQLIDFYGSLTERLRYLDVVVNVAGFVELRNFADTDYAQWTADLHRNLGWAMHSMSLCLPLLRATGRGGSIINFTSIEAHRGAAGIAAYAGAKAGLTNFSRALAVELAPERIRVNAIAPDTTPSATSRNAISDDVRQSMRSASRELRTKALATYVPTGVSPSADELGDAVLFLASDLSSSITGTTIHVDGGTWASSGFLHWPEPFGWVPVPPAPFLREDAFIAMTEGND
jgi:NAD(P)-dependent dehydrogenase (short-subunit alcohol dehydrogenase family)